MKKTIKLPPVEIYDVLHDAESHGVDLPQSIDDWWFMETETNQYKKDFSKKTNACPPAKIYDVLHDAEKHGVKLPKIIDDWWFMEMQAIEVAQALAEKPGLNLDENTIYRKMCFM